MKRNAFGELDLPEFITRKELAALTGLSIHTLARYAVNNDPDGPVMTKFATNVVRYAKADVIAWLNSRRVSA